MLGRGPSLGAGYDLAHIALGFQPDRQGNKKYHEPDNSK